eukprot:TRINITY_DN12854_c0_g1_i1.p1 TRINITY_DN12854_c0_g1~~TRINITY_DN12854_c0_g1_i1.p1  ORF type:complete len:613 (+),score=100.89 TRINITY_DN12854_c0_g1_i1:30-1868(+)
MSTSEDSSLGSSDHSDSVSFENEAPPKVYTKDYKLHERNFSTTERAVPEVPMPISTLLQEKEFLVKGKPNVNLIREHLRGEGRLHKDHIGWLLDNVYEVFCAEPNVLMVPSGVTVCGDIHGQYYDLLKLFEIGGDPSSTTYLFLGDYVDRGDFSIEVCILLFSYKILYPETFFLLRGNHECRHLTEYFTFKEECLRKYDLEVYESMMDVFDALPLAAIMNQQFFCVHGGLSPDIHSLEDINSIDRFTEPPSSGLMCDLLWADPMDPFSPETEEDWAFNELRKTSWSFSYNATCHFLDQNKFLSVIRAHEAQDAGYRMYLKNEKSGFPSLITLFSAPAYLSHFPNKAAILRYENNIMNIRQFNESPHPYNLPNFLNVFAWSLPFVVEKLGELLLAFLDLVNDQVEEEKEKIQEDLERRRVSVRNKVQSVSRMMTIFKKMREEREAVMKLGAISPDGQTIPRVIVGSASKSDVALEISKKLSKNASFETVSAIERVNEARPDPTKLENLVESASRMDSPKRIQRKLSRESIRESSKFKSSLENLRTRTSIRRSSEQIPKISESTHVNHAESSESSRSRSSSGARHSKDKSGRSSSREKSKRSKKSSSSSKSTNI